MEPDFWHDRWTHGQIGFHQSGVNPYLTGHWFKGGATDTGRVLVPLCGKSLDLLWLSAQGQPVVGVELSDIAVQAFCMENSLPMRRRQRPGFDLYEMPSLTLLRGDLFELDPAWSGAFAAVYDRAALISWAPALRGAYVEHIASLSAIGAPTLLITMEFDDREMAGPPFPVQRDEIDRLYSSRYEIKELERRDILATEPRLRAKGVSKLFEVCYRLVFRG